MASDRTGELLAVMPPDAIECVSCLKIRDWGLPRAR
jgi:hypothetical protein